MILMSNNETLSEINRIRCAIPVSTIFPRNITISNQVDAGNASFYKNSMIQNARGEFIERRYFYHDVKPDLQSSYLINSDKTLVSQLTNAIKQIQIAKSCPTDFEFHLNKVTNIITHETAYLPTVMFSLGTDLTRDRQFIPYIDTTGQACHIDYLSALRSSLYEFIERQSLINAWISQKFKAQINMDTKMLPHQVIKFISSIQRAGDIVCYDISDFVPIPTLLLLYRSQSKLDAVQYCISAATHHDPKEAFRKAALEFLQTYNFMYMNAGRDNLSLESGRMRYLNNLLACNTIKTVDTFNFSKIKKPTAFENYLQEYQEPLNIETIYEYISQISTKLYAYSDEKVIQDKKYYFTKVISPDFFLHMATDQRLNFENNYTSKNQLSPTEQTYDPIPFP